MKFPIKKGTHAWIGSMPITFLEDTDVDVQADSMDHVASMLASSAGQRAFGEHLESLKHSTTVTRNINSVPHEVDVDVSYGAGGARVETDKGTPRKIGPVAAGGIGTETVPGASGSGEGFERGRRGAHAAVASEDGQDVETERMHSVPRTEFVVPPKRFPDDVQTLTDPPRSELVGDSPERETPYVGEFTQSGAFSRQPSLERGGYPFSDDRTVPISDRVSTEGRPMGSPDTPGTRNREFPAPSTTAKGLPDQTAVALNVAAKGSDQIGGTGQQSELTEQSDDDNLPEDFPHYELLLNAGKTKYSDLEGKTAEELSGEGFPGIGPSKAEDIVAEMKKKKRREQRAQG